MVWISFDNMVKAMIGFLVFYQIFLIVVYFPLRIVLLMVIPILRLNIFHIFVQNKNGIILDSLIDRFEKTLNRIQKKINDIKNKRKKNSDNA